MGARRESRAFRKGFVLGVLAGAGVMLWKAPQPGARTREQIMETIEGVLFKLLDMPEKLVATRDDVGTPKQPTATDTPPSDAPILPAVDIVIDGPRPSELAH